MNNKMDPAQVAGEKYSETVEKHFKAVDWLAKEMKKNRDMPLPKDASERVFKLFMRVLNRG